MIRIFSLLGCLFLVCSCNYASKAQNSANKKKTGLDDVKTNLSKLDEITSDSIHVVKLKEPGLYITQGFGRVDNMIRLVKIYPNRFIVLDSIQTFMQIDVFRQLMIRYDNQNDWFIYSDISSGTGDLSKIFSLVRVENKRFSILFSYSKFASFVDVEADLNSTPYTQVENTEIKMDRKRIILKTDFESGISSLKQSEKTAVNDTVTFDFSPTENRFIWKKSTNPAMKNKWWSNKGEYLFRI